MKRASKRYLLTAMAACAAVLLSACGSALSGQQRPRVELPQEFRLPQNDVVRLFERRVGRIAIVAEDGNILVMDQTGGNIVRITRDANRLTPDTDETLVYSLPVWSPDAKQIALVELTARRRPANALVVLNPETVMIQAGDNSLVIEQTGEGQTIQSERQRTYVERQPQRVVIQRSTEGGELVSSAVYVASADGKRPLRELFLSRTRGIPYLDWSPDSSHIAFLTQDVEDQTYEVNLIATHDGARPRRLFAGESVFWNWHPDGTSLIAKVGSSNGAPDRLALVDIANDQTTRIVNRSPLAFRAPHFSPDGGYMLITESAGSGRHKLILADRMGKPVRTLIEFEGRISFAWSPAGAKVAYIVHPDERESGGPLAVLDVNSGARKVISNKPVVAFFWSPDGQRIASFSSASATDISPDFKGFDFTPPLDVPYMLLETINPEDGNARGLFYFAPTTAFRRLVTEFDRYSRSVTIWSPDSRKLVFTLTFGNADGSRDYVLETEASGSINPRVIGNGSLAFWSPR
ncbi:MAG: hypothetical protein NZM18_05280 [Thermoflexales bacterium]|nr:hypothetical protein [Thermoflexales bacterium]MDW8352448.1 hypothetical protein [Anaerolineae bacterium]